MTARDYADAVKWTTIAGGVVVGGVVVYLGYGALKDLIKAIRDSKPFQDATAGLETGNQPTQTGGANPTPAQAAANAESTARNYGISVHDLLTHPVDSFETLMSGAWDALRPNSQKNLTLQEEADQEAASMAAMN